MKTYKNIIGVFFIIIFIILCLFTTIIFLRISNTFSIPYSVEADYFDKYPYNPMIGSPNKIINHPDTYAVSQSKYNYAPINFTILRGGMKVNDKEATTNEIMSAISLSDDSYASVVPIQKSFDDSIFKNYFTFKDINHNMLGINNQIFMLPLSPHLDHYLSFDTINVENGDIINNIYLKEMASRIYAANNPYLLPNDNVYIPINSISGASELRINVSSGGISLFNQSVYEFYKILDKNRELIIQGKISLDVLMNWLKGNIYGFTKENYYDIYLILHIIYAKNKAIYKWFAEKCFTYDEFLEALDLDFNKGYKVFASFNPFAVEKIKGKVALYIDAPFNNPNSPVIKSYTIQAWNYFINNWVNISTRIDLPNLQLANVWLYDEFTITSDMNPYQYIYDNEDLFNTENNIIKWRIVVSAINVNENTNPIKIRLGGIWTSIEQKFYEYQMSMTFKVNDPLITKNHLKNVKLILEYYTKNFNDLYNSMYIAYTVSNYTYMHQYYDFQENKIKYINNTITIQSILDGSRIYNTQLRDTRQGVIIPFELINSNTEITIVLCGLFSKFDMLGNINPFQIYFDKISMQYEYEKIIEIKRKTWINYNSLNLLYWTYDIAVDSNLVYLEFEYPNDWIFIDNNFALVQNLNTGKNISSYWISSKEYNRIPLYDNDHIRINTQIIYFSQTGIYRFWFRSLNYISSVAVSDSLNISYLPNTKLKMNDRTTYNITINNNWLNSKIKSHFEGNMTVEFYGYTYNNSGLKSLGPFNGSQIYIYDQNYYHWNYWSFTFIHLYSQQLFGSIRIEFYWHNSDHTKIGFRLFWLYISFESSDIPQNSIISPINNTRFGINKTNYLIVASWHLQTKNVSYTLNNDNKELALINLEEAKNKSIIIPNELIDVPSYLYKFYWFAKLSFENLSTQYDLTKEKEILISISVKSIAFYNGTEIHSNILNTNVKIILNPDFVLNPIQNIQLGQRARIQYTCPDGITMIKFYIRDYFTTFLISKIGNENQTQSSYLYKGYHIYILPYEFKDVGNYTIIAEVMDDVGNVITIESNEFYVIDYDDRLWIMKFLDESVEIIILWITYIGMGIIYKNKNKNKNLEMKFTWIQI